MRYIDLHIHSTYSDGELTPTEVVLLAKKKGLAAISLTDHDTMAGVEEAMGQGKRNNIEVIPGIELSTVHNGITFHILGYGLSNNNPEMNNLLKTFQEGRRKRNLNIIAKLSNLGISVSPERLAKQGQGQIGRPHFARLLVECGAVKTFDQAFQRYLKDGGRAFAEWPKPSAKIAIDMITRAGGVAVLAHPGSIDPAFSKLETFIQELMDMGLTGLEAYYPNHSQGIITKLLEIGRKMDLFITGGSDFHFLSHANSKRGIPPKSFKVPYSLMHDLKARIRKQGTVNIT